MQKKRLYAFLFAIITVAINFWSDCFCLGTANNNSGDFKVLCFNINGADNYSANKTESIIKLIIEVIHINLSYLVILEIMIKMEQNTKYDK